MVYRRFLNGTIERIVVTGRPTSPGSQVTSKLRPSSVAMITGPGPRAGDQVLMNSFGASDGLRWNTAAAR